MSPWCARSILQSCVSLGSRRPAVHVPTLGHSPRSLPHAKCASAAARKGSERELIWLIHFDRMQYLENFIEPRRARELSMQGKEGHAPAKRREPK